MQSGEQRSMVENIWGAVIDCVTQVAFLIVRGVRAGVGIDQVVE